jgi:hypothetical protein
MRRSPIIYLLLLPLLLASSVRIAAALSDADSSSPWTNPVATVSELIDDDNGVSVNNLFTATPRFDSVASAILPILGLAHGTGKDADRFVQPPMFLLYHIFLI